MRGRIAKSPQPNEHFNWTKHRDLTIDYLCLHTTISMGPSSKRQWWKKLDSLPGFEPRTCLATEQVGPTRRPTEIKRRDGRSLASVFPGFTQHQHHQTTKKCEWKFISSSQAEDLTFDGRGNGTWVFKRDCTNLGYGADRPGFEPGTLGTVRIPTGSCRECASLLMLWKLKCDQA